MFVHRGTAAAHLSRSAATSSSSRPGSIGICCEWAGRTLPGYRIVLNDAPRTRYDLDPTTGPLLTRPARVGGEACSSN
jgi:hypothetical protein